MAATLEIGTILAIFNLHNTLMLPTKFQVNWPFGSRKEVTVLELQSELF